MFFLGRNFVFGLIFTLKSKKTLSHEIMARPTLSSHTVINMTRKLSYRKDDRAMRPIYMDALKIFGSPWLRPRLLFQKFLICPCSECLRSIVWKAVQNLKFVALPVPGIIGGTQKFGQFHAPFSSKVLMGFCSDGPCECTSHIYFEVRIFAHSRDNSRDNRW